MKQAAVGSDLFIFLMYFLNSVLSNRIRFVICDDEARNAPALSDSLGNVFTDVNIAPFQQVPFPQHLEQNQRGIQNHLFAIFERLKRNEDRTRPRDLRTCVHPCHLGRS